jgi:S-adenosylmethionine:tRNA ribosyltransferase-isomerase
MDISAFDFNLPAALIAQTPPEERGDCRLLVLDRSSGKYSDSRFVDLRNFLHPSDLLVLNNTKVYPARLIGSQGSGESPIECFLVKRLTSCSWLALMRPARKLGLGSIVNCERNGQSLKIRVIDHRPDGQFVVTLEPRGDCDIDTVIDEVGHVPLPPYIRRPDEERDIAQYQTVYAKYRGSIAAPTAGLHFSKGHLGELSNSGIEIREITLHVGYGTFQPVRVRSVEEHSVAAESFSITENVANALNAAIRSQRRIIAVGTTTTRALETAILRGQGALTAMTGMTELFISPGFEFRLIRGLITNFHVPRSSLLMLTCAFGGMDHVLRAYNHAIREGYRFYSYGDAMLIT